MRLAWLAAPAACLAMLAGCSSDADGPPLVATTAFAVTEQAGAGTSPLDPLYQQTIDVEVVFPAIEFARGDQADTPGCPSTTVFVPEAVRTARGATAALVQAELLDRLAFWDVRLQLCDSGTSTITLHSEIDALNLAFGCFGIPASAMVRDANGFPRLTTFTAMRCEATILDVVANRVLGNPSFEIAFATGPAGVP